MRTWVIRPRDKKIAKNAAKTALLATAALAMAYAVTPSPLTAVATAATAMVQNHAFHESMQTECHWRKFYDREDFDFETWSDSRCQSYLHFPKAGVEELARLFFLPAMRFRASSGHVNALHYDGNDECVTTVLLRMRAKDPWVMLATHLGGRHISAYKMIFREMVQALHDFWFDRLTDLKRHESDVLRWADLIEAKTHASPRTIAFLDGTWLQTCKPGGPDMIQRQLCNRYHRGHGLKWQSICAPVGLILDLFGPLVGRHSDSTMLGRSNLEAKLAAVSAAIGYHIIVYADSAYAATPHVMRGLKRNMIHTYAQRRCNKVTNRVRTSVEWGFGVMKKDWPFLEHPGNAKIFQSPIGLIWPLAALLSNCKTCYVGGNIISDFFQPDPAAPIRLAPTLAQYLDLSDI
jgi:hypothetical protein